MASEFDKEKRKASKKITMVYAGLSEADNPAHYACGRLQEVFKELGLTVEYKDLSKDDNEEVILAMTGSAGVVIALTVEWYGIGYLLQKLLDDCHFYKKSGAFDEIPLFSIVFSRDGFEKEAAIYLETAWQLLGGSLGQQITAIFANSADLAGNFEAIQVIEKRAEQYFRYGLHQSYQLPQSLTADKVLGQTKPVEEMITPEQSAETARQQKEQAHIQSLSDKLKAKLEEKTKAEYQTLPELLMQKYSGYTDQEYQLQILIIDKPAANTTVLIKKSGIFAAYGQEDVPVTISATEETIRQILAGKISFQRAFMTGEMTVKGELTVLYKLDDFFTTNR